MLRMNLAVVSVRLMAGGAMWDSTESQWNGAGCSHRADSHGFVMLLLTSLMCEERPHAGTQRNTMRPPRTGEFLHGLSTM